jgi:arginyl-tRNA synthetase
MAASGRTVSSVVVADLQAALEQRVGAAFAAAVGEPVDPVVRRSQRADFQADGALAVARRLGQNPRDIAARALEHDPLTDVCASADIAGPGFINLTVRDDVLSRMVRLMASDERLGVPVSESPARVVVDYSGPNVAKEMHVGHLRSTFIGDAAVRVLEWLGYEVVRENHIGDWGTPFGMLIEHLLDIGEQEAAHELSIGDLDGFYKAARAKFDSDPSFAERARHRVVLLQGGDEATLRMWRVLIDESEKYFMTVYERLSVRLTADDFVGESAYNDQLRSVVDELAALGLLRDSDGAQCVFPAGFANRDGDPLPLIVRKRDGGYGYASTDLATIRHRIRELGATRMLYVVGLPQRQHFEMVFEAAREAGWLTPPVRAEHVGFGSILGADGKLLRSRAGDSIKLVDLIDEAVRRAGDAVAQKNPDLDATARAEVARTVGIGAIKYADLSTDRTKDYLFDYDRMLSFDGNTAPYLQYAHARIHSLFRRAGIKPRDATAEIVVGEPAEHELVIALLGFEGVLRELERSLDFHRLSGYLFGLASAFTTFYEQCPVLRADAEVRASRLALSNVTARVLAQGLDLLGIAAPEQM